jgi:four helix bundle protein
MTLESQFPEKQSGRRKLATRFEELSIWQEARRLTKQVYLHFKNCRDLAFRDQAQRAALSVMNNIAEGFEKAMRRDFARYLDHAKGSSGEVRSMTYTSEDLAYLSTVDALTLRAGYEQLSKSIAAFTRHLRA